MEVEIPQDEGRAGETISDYNEIFYHKAGEGVDINYVEGYSSLEYTDTQQLVRKAKLIKIKHNRRPGRVDCNHEATTRTTTPV